MRRKMLVALLAIICTKTTAIGFKYEGVNYEATSETTAKVLEGDYEAMGNFSVGDGYVGDIIIPERVNDGETWYDVTSIDDGAFRSCNKLTSIHLPSTMVSVGEMPFSGCSSLTHIDISPSNSQYASVDGVLFNKTQQRLIACPGGMEGTYTVPSSVFFIEDGAFMGCSRLTDITLPTTITYIGKNAFRNCSMLAGINLPEGIGELQANTFKGCGMLSTLTLPSTLVFIDEYVFEGCSKLTSILIPEGVKYLESNALRSCSSLTDVTLPSTLLYIGAEAFSYCSKLDTITIPSGVTKIGMSAFYACPSLQAIYAHPTAVPSLTKEVFSASTYNKATLYVPRRVMEAYKSAPYWKKFSHIEAVPEMLTISSEQGFVGCTTLLHMSLKTVEKGMEACEFDLHLPEGVSPLTDADGNIMVSMEAERIDGGTPSVTMTHTEGSTWHVETNLGGGALVGNEGLFMHLYVLLDEDIDAGVADGSIANGILTVGEGMTILDERGFSIDVVSALQGDVNLSGDVTVTDITLIVNKILELGGDFIWQLADMNKDGMVTVVDVTMVVDAVLNNKPQSFNEEFATNTACE